MGVQEKLLDAIEIIANDSVKKAGYDRTIQAQILSCEDATIGKYRCRYQGATIYAYAGTSDITYTKGAYVYILVPGGDMGKEKTILGTTNKLGINYISQAEGDQAYNIIGKNCVISSNTFYLNTNNKNYKYTIFKHGVASSLSVSYASLNEYIKQSSSLIVGGIFKTNIPIERQHRGHYGITFNLRFLDNTSNKHVIRSYTINEDNMIDNPYKLLYGTRQYQIFDIDGANFIQVESIQIFNQDFPNASGTTTGGRLTKGDIEISNIQICGATRMTESEINGVSISFYTPEGTFFTENSSADSYKTITAQVRIKGKLASAAQNISFYWGSENVGITPRHPYYNKYLGRGWKCLNEKNQIVSSETTIDEAIYTWVPGKDTYTVKVSQATARDNRFKVSILYDGTIVSKIINIKNLNTKTAPQITIESSDGTKFYYDIGHPTLTCKVNGGEPSDYHYYWGVQSDTGIFENLSVTTDQNNAYNDAYNNYNNLKNAINAGTKFAKAEASNLNTYETALKAFNFIQRVDGNKIYDVQINNITNLATFKCSVYNKQNIYLGTAAITLTNSLNGEDLYSLVINNGSAVFQYNEYGVAPNNRSLDIQQQIQALSFTIYDNLGNAIDNDIIRNSKDCKIRWQFPIKNTLLVDSASNGQNSGTDPTQSYKYYDNIINLFYDIAQRYDIKKQINQIKLTVDYKGMNLTAETQFTFTKQGEPGTNGTEYLVKLIPNTKMSDPPAFPMITKAGPDYVLNYGLNSREKERLIGLSTDYQLFKAQLWHSGELVWEGFNADTAAIDGITKPTLVHWEILANKYNSSISDASAFKITDATNGKIQYIKDFLAPSLDTPQKKALSVPYANIIKCSITYEGKTYYGTIPIVTAWTSNSNFRVSLADYTGFRYVIYAPDGTSPQYDNSHPFEFICQEQINDVWEDVSLVAGNHAISYTPGLCGDVKQNRAGNLKNSNLLILLSNAIYRDGLNKNQYRYKPNSKYDGECVNNAVTCEYKQNNVIVGRINIPVHFLLNRYGLASLNAWDGNNVQINQQGGYILAPQMGAGIKDNNNNFTGVVMGAVKQNSSTTTTYNGLLGFSQGAMSIYLDAETGNATFGLPGEGQIKLVPGGTSTIAGWKINTNSFSSNDNKTLLYADESQKQNNRALRFNINNLFKVYSDGGFAVNNKFIVYPDGRFSAANSKFTVSADGTINATAGTIGGWIIENNSLHTVNKTTFGTNTAGSYLGANGFFDFTINKNTFLRYNNNEFNLSIGEEYFQVKEDLIQLGDFIVTPNYGRNMFTTETQMMAISSDTQNSKQWWMWFGGNEGTNPANYDFVLNSSGQVFAKDFICTNSQHNYNICEQIAALWQAVRNRPSDDDDDGDDDGNTNNNDSNYNNNDDMPGEGIIT